VPKDEEAEKTSSPALFCTQSSFFARASSAADVRTRPLQLDCEVRSEIGSGSEPIAEAATSPYIRTAGNGGGSGRAGDGSSDRMAGCPGAGGRWETDAARVVLLELDTSLGLHSQPRKGWPPRPRPPATTRERNDHSPFRDRSYAFGGGSLSPCSLLWLYKNKVTRRNTTKAHQKDFRCLEESYDQKGRKSLPSGGNFNCSVICSIGRAVSSGSRGSGLGRCKPSFLTL